MPGVTTVSRCGPPFPDAATTTRPRRHAISTAADISLRSDARELAAGARAVPCDDPGDMRPMPARVAREALVGEVDRGEEAVVGLDEIRIRLDARIEDCDCYASPGYPLLPDFIGSHHPRVDP